MRQWLLSHTICCLLVTGFALAGCGESDSNSTKSSDPLLLGFNNASRLVFLTETVYKGDLGGLTGADDKCQAEANAAGLAGTYKAWLSDSAESPDSRFARSQLPYIGIDGIEIASDWSDLTDARVINSIIKHADGTVARTEYQRVWSNTQQDGTAFTLQQENTCNDWTEGEFTFGMGRALYGMATSNVNDWRWTRAGSAGCQWEMALYCFQQ